MQLYLKPHNKNTFPLKGILIRGENAHTWLEAMQKMGISLEKSEVFALPNTALNSVWGCIVLPFAQQNFEIDRDKIGNNEWCQQVAPNFFIAEKNLVLPNAAPQEIENLFKHRKAVLHPEFGFAELQEPLDFLELLGNFEEKKREILRPEPSVFIPNKVFSFQIYSVSADDVIAKLENANFINTAEMPKNNLSFFGKIKLSFYKFLFTQNKNNTQNSSNTAQTPPSEGAGILGSLIVLGVVLAIVFSVLISLISQKGDLHRALKSIIYGSDGGEIMGEILSFIVIIVIGWLVLKLFLNSITSANEGSSGGFAGASGSEGSGFGSSFYNGVSRFFGAASGAIGSVLGAVMPSGLGGKIGKMFESMQSDYRNLQQNTGDDTQKLLDMLQQNPLEALKYAIPLDENGSNRGGSLGGFNLSRIWGDFSLFGGNSSRGGSGGGGSFASENYYALQKQYNDTAEELIRQKKHKEAAFVYLKLLKNNNKAAETLEQGRLFQEAASVFLKKCSNKQRAAECYEKGNMTLDAIRLYEEMGENEKVGDLYMSINRRKDAFVFYEKVGKRYEEVNQYVKASLIYKEKMGETRRAQILLLSGWRQNLDAANCLGNYFSNISDEDALKTAIKKVYESQVPTENYGLFLQILKPLYQKKEFLADEIREISYEIIARENKNTPSIISELAFFNPNNRFITKDAIRFKTKPYSEK